ncbi:TonB-dependent receptor family protein [Verrucomicrobiota bacterium sgz303538]
MNSVRNTPTTPPQTRNKKSFRILSGRISALATLIALPALTVAQTPREKLEKPVVEAVGPVELPEVVVKADALNTSNVQVNERLETNRESYPGSVATVSPEELDLQKANNLGEVLVRVPGATYVDEDGRGTKPDISLRGLNPIRSEYVQLLLDGVPVQPSLYSEQAAYYGPAVERIAGIEVFKGGSSVLFGPNTVGGVVNLISRPPALIPFEAVLDTRFDSWGDYSENLFLSGTHGPLSYGVEYLNKGGDGFRDSLGFNVNDLDVKLGYRFNENHWVQLHFQYYNEKSETPGGLLPRQFRSDVTQSNKPNDEFFGERIEGDIRSTHQLTENQRVDLLFYSYNFKRNWFLQDFVDNNSTDLALADQNQQFLRDFTVVGFEPRYTLNYDLGSSTGHELVIGGRVYYDQVNRRVAVGNHGDSREGNGRLVSEDDLNTLALALFVQNEFKITERLSIVPGLRYEHIEQAREDVFNDLAEQSSDYNAWVPAIGLKYEFAPQSLVYANVSRAFRPPSFADSFNPDIGASNLDLKPSTAWIYEVGVRTNPYPWLLADLGIFYTDFKDQVVVSGGVASNFDTRTYGFEGLVQLGLVGLTHAIHTGDRNYTGDHEVSLLAGATIVNSTFRNGAFAGNDLPYVPNQNITFGVRYSFRNCFELQFQGRYVGDRFTDNANTMNEDPVGTIGVLQDYTVYDIKSRWQISENVILNAGINNLFDETYGTQRRTTQQKGIFPGPTRQFYVGATLRF